MIAAEYQKQKQLMSESFRVEIWSKRNLEIFLAGHLSYA